MKTQTLTTILLIFFINCFSQENKTCNSSEDDFVELNTFSLNKCDIDEEEKSVKTRKITANIATKKNNRIAHYIRKDKSNTKSYIKKEKPEILFTLVDEIPLFKNCNNSKDKKCFSNEFYKHFSKHFLPETVSEDGIKERIFVSFVINTDGSVSKTQIRSSKKSKKLEKEIKRVIRNCFW